MAKSQKQVQVIARYQFKADPRKVCYLVRASNGVDTYMVCLFDGKATSCRCASRKPCYHMTQLELREQARSWEIPAGQSLVRDGLIEAPNGNLLTPEELANVPGAAAEREAALAAARAASEAELAKIEQETLAQIEREEAAAPVGKSEQARLADLPFSDDEKKYSQWTEQEMLAAPLNGSRAFSLLRR